MGKITTLFVRKVLEEVDSDIDKGNAVVRSMGIDLDRPVYMMSDAHYYSFFERAAAIDRNGMTLPLRTGAAMRSDDYGAFGLAWKSATTLRGSYTVRSVTRRCSPLFLPTKWRPRMTGRICICTVPEKEAWACVYRMRPPLPVS